MLQTQMIYFLYKTAHYIFHHISVDCPSFHSVSLSNVLIRWMWDRWENEALKVFRSLPQLVLYVWFNSLLLLRLSVERHLKTFTLNKGKWSKWCLNTQTRSSPTSSSWKWVWSGSPMVSRNTSPTTGAGWTFSLWM